MTLDAGTLIAVAYAHADPTGTPLGTLIEATSLSVNVELEAIGADWSVA